MYHLRFVLDVLYTYLVAFFVWFRRNKGTYVQQMAVEISFLTKDNHDVRSKLIFFLDRTIEEYRLRLGWNLNGRELYRSSRRIVNGLKELLLGYYSDSVCCEIIHIS